MESDKISFRKRKELEKIIWNWWAFTGHTNVRRWCKLFEGGLISNRLCDIGSILC